MGIKGLMSLISEHAPKAVKEQEMENYFGRKVAVDASMSLYQFLIQIRSGPEGEVLTNDAGEVTSHLQGMFYRTIAMLDKGIKPVFVFDGKPPQLKGGELEKRTAKRAEAEADLKEAEEAENQEDVNKYKKRLVKVTKEHNQETRHLLGLMGVPIVEAPSEAEAQCAVMVKNDLVYGVATEDMDALTFGTPRLLRHLTFSGARKEPIVEIDLALVLQGLNLTMDQFIDLCILCGCDYVSARAGVAAWEERGVIRLGMCAHLSFGVVVLLCSLHDTPDDEHSRHRAEVGTEADPDARQHEGGAGEHGP